MDDRSTSRNEDDATRDNAAPEDAGSDYQVLESGSLPDEEDNAPTPDVDHQGDDEETGAWVARPQDDNQPGRTAGTADRDINDEIDEHMPLPVDEEYHDDDSAKPDPYDVGGEVDEMMPRPTGGTMEETDDFSTSEELDVDTAPSAAEHHDEAEEAIPLEDEPESDIDAGPSNADVHTNSFDRVRVMNASSSLPLNGTPVYVGSPSGSDPINDESSFYASSYSSSTRDTDSDVDLLDREPDRWEGGTGAAPASLLPPEQDGVTTCPVCGRATDALRFCGYCGAQLTTTSQHDYTATSFGGRLEEHAGVLLEPLSRWTRPAPVRFFLLAGAVIVLLALLANNGGLALVFGSAILPLILVFWCLHNDLSRKGPPVVTAGFGVAGTIVGVLIGWLASIVVANWWFDTGTLNYGATGYWGGFAERVGNPPLVVWAVVGIILPLVALGTIVGGPVAMRQVFSFRNEVMDGLTLGAVIGAGYSVGTAIVFASPMVTGGGPDSDAAGWTLTTLGLTIIRPLIWTLSGGMLGAAAWRYLSTGTIGSALVPAAAGVAVPLLFTLISIQLSQAGLWPEFLGGALMAAIASFFFRKTIGQAIRHDRRIPETTSGMSVPPVAM